MFNRAGTAYVAALLLPLGAVALEAAAARAPADMLFQAGQQFWTEEIATLGGQYRPARLAHFTGPARGVCDMQGSVAGSFYCPAEGTIYIDDAATAALTERARADAGVAVAYVVGHELAHHVQAIIGTTAVVQQARMRSAPEIANRTLATFELQADCYAGLWLRWANGRGAIKLPADPASVLATVEPGDRTPAPGRQVLDPLDQGTAAQRLNWLRRGLGGQFNDCDTFGAEAVGKL
jgi:predicted metalloprotease